MQLSFWKQEADAGMTLVGGILTAAFHPENAAVCLAKEITKTECRHGVLEIADAGFKHCGTAPT